MRRRVLVLSLAGAGVLATSVVLATRVEPVPRTCSILFELAALRPASEVPEPEVALRWDAVGPTEARVIESRSTLLAAADRLLSGGKLGALRGRTAAGLADWIGARLQAAADPRARVLTVTVRDADAALAAQAANAVCGAYVDGRAQRRREQLGRLVRALKGEQALVDGDSAEADKAFLSFSRDAGLGALPLDAELTRRRAELARLADAAVQAKLERIGHEARDADSQALDQARRLEKALRKEHDARLAELLTLAAREAEWNRLARAREEARQRLARLSAELGRLAESPSADPARVLDWAEP